MTLLTDRKDREFVCDANEGDALALPGVLNGVSMRTLYIRLVWPDIYWYRLSNVFADR